MSPMVNRPNPDCRRVRSRWIRWRTAALAAAFAASGLLVIFSQIVPLSAARPIRAVSIEMDMTIRTPLSTQYESTVLLEDRNPVTLVLEYEAPRRAGYEQRVQWRCDRGSLEKIEGVLRNSFYPPTRSRVSTIEAEVGFFPRQGGRTLDIAAFKETAKLHVISITPGILLRDGVIDGYKMGRYLDPNDAAVRKKFDLSNSWARIHPEKFQRPRAFYLVDDTSRQLPISRHVRLGDFMLDYPWFTLGKRQYIALDYGLVRKIEDLIADLNRAGMPGDKFKFIYGFRSPAYNTGRMEKDGDETLKTPFSLHQYGKAVDFILDADGDGKLDDLDGDGKITVRDAGVLVHHVNALDRRYRAQRISLYGGAGIYDHHDFWERPVQTPYVHMDVRGFLGEGGVLIRWPNKWPDTGEPIAWGKL